MKKKKKEMEYYMVPRIDRTRPGCYIAKHDAARANIQPHHGKVLIETPLLVLPTVTLGTGHWKSI